MTVKQNFSTKNDLRKLERKLGKGIDGNTKAIGDLHREMLAFKWEVDQKFQDFQEKIEKFKDEIISHIDPVLKELTRSREEQTIMGHQIDDHEKRISHLETTPL